MRFLIICSIVFSVTSMCAQLTLKVEVSADTIMPGEFVEVTYSIENGEGRFEPPNMSGLPVISGPNTSSSFMIQNGKKTSSQSYSYIFRPQKDESIIIPPAHYVENDKKQIMEGVTIIVTSAGKRESRETSAPTLKAIREKKKF